jgi:hypothetical protein
MREKKREIAACVNADSVFESGPPKSMKPVGEAAAGKTNYCGGK